MTGFLVDINKTTYVDKLTKELKPLSFAVLQVGHYEESIMISEAKAKEIAGKLEQEFDITIRKSTKVDQKYVTISFGVGRCLTPTKPAK